MSRNSLIMIRNMTLIFMASTNLPTICEVHARLHENIITKYNVNAHNGKTCVMLLVIKEQKSKETYPSAPHQEQAPHGSSQKIKS
jgi:hypothetical protein